MLRMLFASYPAYAGETKGVWCVEKPVYPLNPALPPQSEGPPGTHQRILESALPYLMTEVLPGVTRVQG